MAATQPQGAWSASHHFVAALEQELPKWEGGGIISHDQAQTLHTLYAQPRGAADSSQLILRLVYVLGALMVGIGGITFVALNWSALTFATKAVILNAALATVYAAGITLYLGKRMPLLGHALIFVGCLLFGADIGQMAQGANAAQTCGNGYAAWGFGTLAVAFVIGSQPCAWLAMIAGSIWTFASWDQQVFCLRVAILSAAALISAARMRSSLLAELGMIAGLVALGAGIRTSAGPGAVILPYLLGGVGLWLVGEGFRGSSFGSIYSRPAAITGIAVTLFTTLVATFRFIWDDRPTNSIHSVGYGSLGYGSLIAVVALVALGLIQQRYATRRISGVALALGGAGTLLLLLICVLSIFYPLGAAGTIVANLAALLFGASLVAIGVRNELREAFWTGAAYLTGLVIARFFEFDTNLSAKAAAFLIFGLVFVAAGVAYERHIQSKEAHHEN